MLSAFTARPIVDLKQRDKSKIESILAYGDRLLVGLSSGSLRIYRVNDDFDREPKHNGEPIDVSLGQANAKAVDLLREVEKFSRRGIEQLAMIKEANLLVSLSDSFVSIHDLQTFNLQEQLSQTKGAATFAVTSNIVKDKASGIPSIVSRVVVSVKRKLVLWSWHDSELSSSAVEILLPAPPRTLTWATGTKVICGMNSGYVFVDVETKGITDIIGPGSIGGSGGPDAGRFGGAGTAGMSYMGMSNWVPKGLATKLSENKLLLAKDINTLFIDSEGEVLEKRQIPWSVAPEAIGFSYPFLLSLQSASKGGLEIRNPETLSLLQTISLPAATTLHVPQPNISLAHAGKGFLVASDRCIWRMGALGYDSQINELVAKKLFDEAISLLNLLEDALLDDKEGNLRDVKMLKAQGLFERRKFREALDLFTEASAPPERVIRLYPDVISGGLTRPSKKRKSSQSETNGTIDHLEPKSPPRSIKRPSSRRSSIHSNKASSILSSPQRVRSGDETASTSAFVVENRDLPNAVRELNAFLVDARTRLQRFLNPDGTIKPQEESSTNGSLLSTYDSLLLGSASDTGKAKESQLLETAQLVDTTLFRGYMLAQPSLAGPLFRLNNFCDPDVVNEKLFEKGRYNDLVDFFNGKNLHRPALELLKRFGQSDKEDPAAPFLHGPLRTITYLQTLPSKYADLVLEFAQWPLESDPDEAMEIFVADSENAETLPRNKVLEFLAMRSSRLAVVYLEHIITELNDLTPDFHNRLVNLYIERLKSRKSDKDHSNLAFEDLDERNAWLEKLVEFLRLSHQYSTAKAFGQLPRDEAEFNEARAVVLSRMGQHKQALEIYVFNMENYAKAESYCNHVFLEESDSSQPSQNLRQPSTIEENEAPPSIYHTLLSLYLAPKPPNKPNWPPALDLLSKHGSRLPASSTMELLPTEFPIKELESYFQGRMRAANSTVNQDRIVAGLQKIEVLDAQARLLLGDGIANGNGGRNRKVVIREERLCGICHRRLGAGVISVFPE
ncbi:MAG: Vacuolar morphogenesis protein 6 [Vezdaea aestivalis]|nr:MAG: Vacuolar morphogenesis protein 6 [Vezdaea aestivalis]